MTVKIKRNTGWIGIGTNILIILNGEKVAKVSENSQVEVVLPDEKANLRIRHAGVKSNEIEVKDGDVIEIKRRRWYTWSFILFIITMILSSLIFDPSNRIKIIVLIAIPYIIILTVIEGYSLNIINES